jgi:hypothetical protein
MSRIVATELAHGRLDTEVVDGHVATNPPSCGNRTGSPR